MYYNSYITDYNIVNYIKDKFFVNTNQGRSTQISSVSLSPAREESPSLIDLLSSSTVDELREEAVRPLRELSREYTSLAISQLDAPRLCCALLEYKEPSSYVTILLKVKSTLFPKFYILRNFINKKYSKQ